jgi:hypothetical protein
MKAPRKLGHDGKNAGGESRKKQPSIIEVNSAYEDWLRGQCAVDEKALACKHDRMRESPFVFLRATFFRWAGEIETILSDLASAPPVLAVGDAHVENFGIWHDAEGRLVWGINDFDDAALIPYAFDLVRLAASAQLSGKTAFTRNQICSDILKGYSAGLNCPTPFVLNEKHWWLNSRVQPKEKTIKHFWTEIDGLKGSAPKDVKQDLRAILPGDCEDVAYRKRRAGGGSLGRPRYVAIAHWRGGRIVREAKAVVPSAWDWSHDIRGGFRGLDLAKGPSRSPDPNLSIENGYLLRRLAPEARKLELGKDDDITVDHQLLQAMGQEIGAIHGADPAAAKQIRKHLDKAETNWLTASAKEAESFVRSDFEAWKRPSSRKGRA